MPAGECYKALSQIRQDDTAPADGGQRGAKSEEDDTEKIAPLPECTENALANGLTPGVDCRRRVFVISVHNGLAQ
jgi:hypothetical protein